MQECLNTKNRSTFHLQTELTRRYKKKYLGKYPVSMNSAPALYPQTEKAPRQIAGRLVDRTGFEPVTPSMSRKYSNQLS